MDRSRLQSTGSQPHPIALDDDEAAAEVALTEVAKGVGQAGVDLDHRHLVRLPRDHDAVVGAGRKVQDVGKTEVAGEKDA